jgi:hypothetical protein
MRTWQPLVGAVVLTAMGCGSNKSPTGVESLPVTTETVQAAVDMVTTGHVNVNAVCSASVPVNCKDGTPGSPIVVDLTRTGLTIGQTSELVFTYTAQVAIVSEAGIPLTIPLVGTCYLSVDTAPGASPTVQVAGKATFDSRTPGGPIDRVTMTAQVTGMEAADLSLTGTSGCATVGVPASSIESLLNNDLANAELRFCGAPGPPLLVACLVGVETSDLR